MIPTLLPLRGAAFPASCVVAAWRVASVTMRRAADFPFVSRGFDQHAAIRSAPGAGVRSIRAGRLTDE